MGAINEAGLVLGSADLPVTGQTRPFLVVPGTGPDGKPTWYSDADGDGRNDLMVNLGIPPGAAPENGCYAALLNDHGVILGHGGDTINPWILSPWMTGAGLSWTTLDADGANAQMMPLPALTLPLPLVYVMEQGLNNHGVVALVISSEDSPNAWWQQGFLLPPSRYEVADGAVTAEYPVADANGDGINDYLISLGNGQDLSGRTRPLVVTAINDQGDVAGLVWNGFGGDVNGEHPFVLRPISVVTGGSMNQVWCQDDNGDGLNDLVIYLPPGAVNVVSMNENGTLVGTASDRSGAKAALWQVDWATRTVTFKSLGLVEGEKKNYATAVNASGQVVGTGVTFTKLSSYPSYTGWLWNQGTMSPLSALTPALSGTIYTADGINDSGMIVGEQATTIPGIGSAFIAVPITQP